MGVAHMDDGGRRCALPGCDKAITSTAGRPERRYCTAAHRAAARRARRAAAQAEHPDGPDVLAEALPWLRDALGTGTARGGHFGEPGVEVRPPPQVTPVAPATEASSRSRGGRPMPRRRHALALLGVAGILAGGYVVTDAQSEAPPTHAAPEGEAAPDGVAADTWAQRATVALASVNRQLDTLAQTEEEWRRLPESRRAVVPGPVAALEDRRSVLQRRRATLQAQLDDYRSLRRTQLELASSEQHLRAVESALADAPSRRRSSEQEAAIAALEEQRDLRLRRRDVQRTELATLQDGVSTATRTPLPDDGAATAKVADDVLEMVHNGGTEPTPPDSKPPRPEVVAGRESEDGKPRQEVGTSGPPDPRGPRDESDERRAAKKKRAAEAAARTADDRTARKQPAERHGSEKHADLDRSSEKPHDDRKSAEKHSTPRADSGGEKPAGTPVEKSAVEAPEQAHDRQKDQESRDDDSVANRARYRQAEMRAPMERKTASSDAVASGPHYRRAEARESPERKSSTTDTEGRGSRYRHTDVKKRKSTESESEDRGFQHRGKDRESEHRGKDRDSRGNRKDRGPEDRGSTEHGSTQRESGDRGARHRHDANSERAHRADDDKHRGGDGRHRGDTSADR